MTWEEYKHMFETTGQFPAKRFDPAMPNIYRYLYEQRALKGESFAKVGARIGATLSCRIPMPIDASET